MKLDILAFGAHPDDVELGCGATLAKEIHAGKKVGIIDLTRGELGTRGSADLRDLEAKRAAEILKIHVRENLGMRDGFFVNDEAHQLKIIQKIRQYQPDILICNTPRDRHIDHGKGSALVSDAAFLSGLMKIETHYKGEIQQAWRPKLVLHYIQWNNETPNFVVDVTGFMDQKMDAIQAYASQFYQPGSNEPVTPIATQNFFDSISYRAKDLGRLIGVDYAEGFICQRVFGVQSVFDVV